MNAPAGPLPPDPLVALADRCAGRHADNDVGEVPAGRPAHAQAPERDARAQPLDGAAGRLDRVHRRLVHEHVDVAADEPARGDEDEHGDEEPSGRVALRMAGAHGEEADENGGRAGEVACEVEGAGRERRASELLRAHGLAERAVLTSFLPEVLATCRKLAPEIRTLSSYDRNSVERMGGVLEGLRRQLEVSDIIAVEKSVLAPHWQEISELVPLDRLGAWVPNTEEDIRFWYEKGIRQITTDTPTLAKSLQ